ncbi:hypothetical protein J3F84DRAFT_401849 [Trichoderma pleuroticola]
MAQLFYFLLIYATFMAPIKAEGLSDISNNLASDLGPLLSLFGDQITRQYLSESIGFLDYFIFAMAPLGIIATITAVIRVCGSSSLRAFIGRAQEGQGTTEAELCTSTSADVCELFNKGQANQNQQQGQQIAQPRLQLFTSYLEDSSNECWRRMMSSGNGNAVFNKIGRSNSENSLDLAPKPNLSLNVGIRRQLDWVFYVIALVGFLLQAGILVFAGTAVWLLEWNLQKPNSEASRNYASGIFIAGTITLCLGAWGCAALIGQTTNEQYYRRSPQSSDVLYWIQPGPQVIGDQSFGSFAYSDAKSKDRLMMWTSSTKDFDKNFEPVTYIAVSLVLFGYIAQFIGLRGLNAWISIAQLGITIIMSILRGILRMKRLDKNNNRLNMWQDLVTGHELDWLAFDIAEQELAKKLKDNSQNTSVEKYQIKDRQYEEAIRLDNLIQNRTLLSNLTGHFEESMDAKSYLPWKDERVGVRAKAKKDFHLRVKAAIAYEKSNCEETTVSIKLKPPTGPDRINWSVNSSQIEAILGLWLWSVLRRENDLYGKKKGGSDFSNLPNKVLNSKIFRVVSAIHGKQEWDDSFDTDMSLWLGSGDSDYKYSLADYWIPSDERSVIIGESSNDSTAGFQRFCERNDTPERKRVNIKGYLVKDTEHTLLDLCAQELFVALLHSMKALEFRKLDKISVSESGGHLHLDNPVISALAKCFTDNGLGTHSDAISCLIPSLRSEIPPYQEKVISALTPVAANYRRDDEWSSAEVVLSWACEYHHKLNPADTDETSDFMVALRELGELYRWSLAQMQHNFRQDFGARGIEQMASKFGTANPTVALYNTVTQKINGIGIDESQGWMDGFHRAVMDCRRADALYYLCFAGNTMPHKLSKCLPLAARNGWDEIVSALVEMKLSPDIQDDDGRTAASHYAGSGLRRSLQRIMDMNANLNISDKHQMTPLAYAAMNGRENIVRLLTKIGQVGLNGASYYVERAPLWLAIYQDHFGTISELLDKGASAEIKHHREWLLDLAIRKGHSGVTKALLERCLAEGWECPDPLRNHSDGLFSTRDIPPLASTPDTETRHVKFNPPYSEAPRLMIGISGLLLGPSSPLDMHWDAGPISKTGFTLTLRRYEKSWNHEDYANVTWIELGAEEQEFQGTDATARGVFNGYIANGANFSWQFFHFSRRQQRLFSRLGGRHIISE